MDIETWRHHSRVLVPVIFFLSPLEVPCLGSIRSCCCDAAVMSVCVICYLLTERLQTGQDTDSVPVSPLKSKLHFA